MFAWKKAYQDKGASRLSPKSKAPVENEAEGETETLVLSEQNPPPQRHRPERIHTVNRKH